MELRWKVEGDDTGALEEEDDGCCCAATVVSGTMFFSDEEGTAVVGGFRDNDDDEDDDWVGNLLMDLDGCSAVLVALLEESALLLLRDEDEPLDFNIEVKASARGERRKLE